MVPVLFSLTRRFSNIRIVFDFILLIHHYIIIEGQCIYGFD